MQMIKSIGQLPNTVYLLCYDRDIIWNIFENQFSREGPGFVEKIVQHEIELPKPHKNALLSMLDHETSFLVGSTETSSRWNYIVRSGVHRWIQSPRDVVRLANAVKFSWPGLRDEVDRQDLLAMEGMRLFDTDTFHWIRDNRDYFFSEGQYLLANDEKRKQAAKYLRDTIREQDQPEVLEVISILFPQVSKWFDTEASFFSENHEDVMRRRGIGSPAGFDGYFGLQASSDAIPLAVVREIATTADTSNAVSSILREYLGRRNRRGEMMISMLLEELRLYFSGTGQTMPTQSLLDGIFEIGEDIIGIEADLEMFQFSPTVQLTMLISTLLERWGPEQSQQCLRDAFRKQGSPAFLASVFVELGRELGVFESEVSRRQHISKDVFNELGQLAIDRIQTSRETGTLHCAPFYFEIVRTWAYVVDSNAPKEWLTNGISDNAEFMAKACIGLVSYSVGNGKRRYALREKVDEELYDTDVLLSQGRKHLMNSEVSGDQRRLIAAVVDGLEDFQQKK